MMQRLFYLLMVISTITLFNSAFVSADLEAVCANQTNTDCDKCLAASSSCAFCSDNKKCFYSYENIVNRPCDISQVKFGTCNVAFRVWIIVVAVCVGVILIVLIIFLCCICRKCKKCRIRKFERQQERDNQQMEQRRAEAEARTAERTRVTDQIRMKYGILKANDAGTDYARMS